MSDHTIRRELIAFRPGGQRGPPFGGEKWTGTTARRLGLAWPLRPRSRPWKAATWGDGGEK